MEWRPRVDKLISERTGVQAISHYTARLTMSRSTYLNLSKMAVDILSIPAMSAEPERLFSRAMITITDRRNRLGSDVIEAPECVKSRPRYEIFMVTILSLGS